MPLEENWYKYWFDSPYYNLLYSNRDSKEAQLFIDRLIEYLHPEPGSRILDLACGNGRHSVYLASKGFEVTGLDLSPRSIREAQKFARPGLEFYVHDIRDYFRINYYSYIFNFFTSFGYFNAEKDNLKVLRSAHMGLFPGGTLVIDFMNEAQVRRQLPVKMNKTVGDVTFEISKWADETLIHKDIRFEDKEKPYHFTECVQALTLADFKGYFERTGFKLKAVFGNYKLEAFDEAVSDRLIMIAEK